LKRHLFWPGLFLVLLLGGCQTLPPTPPPVTGLTAKEVLSQLRSRQQKVQSFQAKGRITYLSPKENYSGTTLMAGRLPATLKVNILDFLGRTILTFATNGNEVKILSPRESKLFSGPATPGNLAAFIPPTVSLSQTVHLLVGALPFSSGPPDYFTFEAATGRYLLEWRRGSALTERLWVQAQGLNPVADEWYGGAALPRFSAELAGYGSLAPHLPEKITLKSTTPKKELRLVYSELKVNPPLIPTALTLTAPHGFAVIPLGK
jgi:hypothetical protein